MGYRLLKCSFLIVFLNSSLFAFSQNKIKGKVLDAKNLPLPYTNVTVYNEDGSNFITYAVSDENGNYNLELDNGVYLFKISNLGHGSISEIRNITKNEVIDFVLPESDTELKEVVVEGRGLEASIRNDTTKYNLKNLTTGNEENLKDILKKLPGVEINENGKIVANGKQVDKLLIDGKEFFGDQHQLATENITSEMVQGISLIENFNGFADLENQKKSDKTAMNIEIGGNYKGKIKGNIMAGGGYQNKYEMSTNLFSFRDKINLFFIGNANNIGNQTFTFQDYISFQGGINNIIGEEGSTVLSGEDLPAYLFADNNVKTKSEQFGALNVAYTPSEKFKLNTYLIFDKTNISEEQFIKQTYIIDNQGVMLNLDNSKNNSFFINNSFIDATYKPSNNTVLEYIADFSPQNNDLMSNDNFSVKKYNTSRVVDNFSLNQALKFKHIYKRFLLSATAYHSLKNKNEDLNIKSNNVFLSLLFPASDFKAHQNLKNRNENYGVNTFVSAKIMKKSFVKLKYNVSKKVETFETDIENNPQQNDINLDFTENKSGISFYNRGKPLVNYDVGCDVSFIKSGVYENIYFLPFANIKFNFGRSHNFLFSYRQSLDLPQADNIVNSDYIFSYNTLVNNRNISADMGVKYDNFRVNYFIYDLFSGTLLNLGADHSTGKDFITTNTLYNSDYQINIHTIGDFYSKSNVYLLLNKKFGKIPFTLSFRSLFSYIDNHNYINDKPNQYVYKILNNNLSVSSNFREAIFNFEFGYRNNRSIALSQNTDTESEVVLHKPYLNLFLSYGGFNLTINSSLEAYKTNTLEKQLYNISPSVYYKTKNKKWKFYLKGQDILNLNKNYIIENIAYNHYFEDRTVSILGGFIIAGLVYKF